MRVSVVIRVRDEVASIGAVLDALAAQTLPHEVVLVDSGSRDGTLGIARARPEVRLLELARSEFSFGRALNLGTRATSGDVVVALSADAVPRDAGWLARVLAWFDDPAVACVFGETRDHAGRPLRAAARQTAALARAHPEWGYSNGAGAFRRELWAQRPFREDLPACEDREWALWALGAGERVCVLDPALAVDHDHSRDPLAATFRRVALEHRGFATFLDLPPYRVRDLAAEWWREQGWHASRARARLSPRRAARLAGKWWGLR